jgi:hypothetical protein
VRLAAIALVCLSGLACKRATPGYCGGEGGEARCAAGTFCNPETLLCEAHDGGLGDASDAGEVPPRCQSDEDCTTSEEGPACVVETGTCVACLESRHCADQNRPFCVDQHCAPCTSDTQCPAVSNNEGICVGDGHCATAGELVYVQNVASCSATDNGTIDHPFCTTNDAVAALARDRAIIIIRGQVPPWSLSGQPTGVELVTVVGQQGATVMGTDVAGVKVANQAKVDIRALRITGGMGTGVTATSGATLILDRCRIDHNHGSGIVINGAAYRITNTVVVDNGSLMVNGTNTITFGGVEIRNSDSLQPTIFTHNTVVANTFGMACDQAYPVTDSIVALNTIGTAGPCGTIDCCVPPAADFTADYHLVATSVCIGQASDASSVGNDIDGQPRPKGAASDCGADEYY